MAIEPKRLEELRAQVGEVHLLTAAEETVAFRRLSRPEYSRFRSHVLDDQKRSQANDAIVATCALEPKGVELEAIFDRKPALVDVFASELVRIAGGGAAVDAKKL